MSDWRDSLPQPRISGIGVGDGWRPLVEYAYKFLDKHECLHAAQVKEKFGQLRFYVDHDYDCPLPDGCWDGWDAVELHIEALSGYICEQCGAYGRLRSGGWVKTLCDNCAVRDGRD